MVRGASHLHKFYINLSLTEIAAIELTYSQNGEVILKKVDTDMDYDSVEECLSVRLSQEDTLKFHPVGIPASVKDSLITLQLKFLGMDGYVYVSKPMQERLYDVLNDEVL